MVRLEDQMNNENLEMLQQIFEVCKYFYSSTEVCHVYKSKQITYVACLIFKEADEDGGGGLDLDEFRQAMVKTMAGKGEVVSEHYQACLPR